MSLEIIVPVVMATALIWWIGRSLSWTTRLVTAAVTLILIIIVVAVERMSQ